MRPRKPRQSSDHNSNSSISSSLCPPSRSASAHAMAVVQVTDIQVHNNPAPFMAPLEFEISFQCVAELADGLSNWRELQARLWWWGDEARAGSAPGAGGNTHLLWLLM